MKQTNRLRSRVTILAAGLLFSLIISVPSALATFVINEYPITSGAEPFGITAGPDGNLWFVERNGNSIGVMSPTGTLLHEYPVLTPSAGPFEITEGPDGNLWFTEQYANKIGMITPSGTVTEYPITDNTGGMPQAIIEGPDGNLWFTEQNFDGGSSIDKITTSGVISSYSVGGGEFNDLWGITAGSDGNVWFANGSSIDKITPDGNVTSYPTGIDGGYAMLITKGSDGNVWFDDWDGSSISKMTTSGVVTTYPTPTSSDYYGMNLGPDGNVWFSGADGVKIGYITPSGSVTEYTPPTSGAGPAGIAAGPDGNVWFAEQGVDKIGEVVLPNKPGITNHHSTVVSGSSVTVDVLTGISGDPDSSTLRIIAGPSHGTAVDPPGTITYTPTNGYVGSDSLTYQVCSLIDPGVCTQASLDFTVTSTNVTVGTVRAPDTGFGAPQQTSLLPIVAATPLPFVVGALLIFSDYRRYRHLQVTGKP